MDPYNTTHQSQHQTQNQNQPPPAYGEAPPAYGEAPPKYAPSAPQEQSSVQLPIQELSPVSSSISTNLQQLPNINHTQLYIQQNINVENQEKAKEKRRIEKEKKKKKSDRVYCVMWGALIICFLLIIGVSIRIIISLGIKIGSASILPIIGTLCLVCCFGFIIGICCWNPRNERRIGCYRRTRIIASVGPMI